LSYRARILFTGGEPTIRQDIAQISDLAHREFDARISMLSNARRFCDDRFTSRMVESGLSWVGASLYSHVEPVHDELTYRKGSYAETVAGIRSLENSGVRVQVRTLLTRPTFTNMPETVDFIASKFNNVEIGISAMDVVGNAFQNRKTMVARLSEAAPYVGKSIDIARNRGLRISVTNFPMCLLEPHHRTAVNPRTVMHTTVKYRSPHAVQLRSDKSCTVGSHEKCCTCSIRDRCSGTWQSYVSIYGDQEMHPNAAVLD
jgi:sulfatase maturation enzyme AslB (radical SAM superfamily)